LHHSRIFMTYGILGSLKAKSKNYKTKNYKLRLIAGSWGLIEAWKTLSRRLWLWNLSRWRVRCVCCRIMIYSVCWALLAGRWLVELGDYSSFGCLVFICASRSPGVSLSLSVGKTTVDENIMCVACGCIGLDVFVLGRSGITYLSVVWCPCRLFCFRCGMWCVFPGVLFA
jgi:hypothetical protein